ncbi:YbaK/EbsC family protein, partial [Micromonospora marina]|uniref:YbaK/EbsC family protein n=1 Tax=Micromonospora marina TaxID=307120 RepID=UPI003456315E
GPTNPVEDPKSVSRWVRPRREVLTNIISVSRLSMPDAEAAKAATGYARGTITPFGSTTAWPVVADERLRGREITLGAGEHGLAVAVHADAALAALGATVADVTDEEPTR